MKWTGHSRESHSTNENGDVMSLVFTHPEVKRNSYFLLHVNNLKLKKKTFSNNKHLNLEDFINLKKNVLNLSFTRDFLCNQIEQRNTFIIC